MHQAPTTTRQQNINQPNHQSLGSVYLVTLITVAAIVSMVLVGVKLRSTSNTQSTFVEDIVENSNTMIDATEYALASVASNATWATKAQSGTAFDDFTLNGTSYSSTVVDAGTLALPTDRTIDYRIKLRSTTANTITKSQFDLNYSKIDYNDFVQGYGAWYYWPLNEATGDATAVESIHTLDGTYLDPSVAGGTTNDEGGVVPEFVNSSDQIQVPYNSKHSEWAGTYSLWMKTTEQKAFTVYGIIGSRYKDTGSPNLALTTISGSLHAFVSDDGTYSAMSFASSSFGLVQLDTWHHVAMTFGPTGVTIYLDGVLVASKVTNTSGISSANSNKGGQQPFNIGASYISTFGAVNEVGFMGSIAHVVHFWGNQLTALEVAELAAVKPDLNVCEIIEDSWTIVYE